MDRESRTANRPNNFFGGDNMPTNSITFYVSRRCNARCKMCLSDSGPERSERMSIEDACDLMDQINKIKLIKNVEFTGGEPFIDFNYLLAILKRLEKKYLIFSNGFWGKDPVRAKEIARELARLKHRGKIILSTSREHQRFVSVDAVKNAAGALIDAKIPTLIHIIAADEKEFEGIKSRVRDLAGLELIRFRQRAPNGRSKKFFEFEQKQADRFFDITPCGTTVTIFEDGMVMPCPCDPEAAVSGSPLILGNVLHEPLKAILDRSEGLLSILRVSNHFKILVDFLAERGLDDRLQPGYINSCELCRDIFNNPELSGCILDSLDHLKSETAIKGNLHEVIVEIPGGKKLLLKVREVDRRKWRKCNIRNRADVLKLLNACTTNCQFTTGEPDIKNKVLPISMISIADAVKVVKTGLGGNEYEEYEDAYLEYLGLGESS